MIAEHHPHLYSIMEPAEVRLVLATVDEIVRRWPEISVEELCEALMEAVTEEMEG